MKKAITIILIISLIFAFFIPVKAESTSPVSSEFSDISNGKATLTVKIGAVTKLTGLIIRVEYDTSVFSVVKSEADYYIDDDGNTIDNFSGMWSFGALYDKKGYSAAFLSSDGVTKSAPEAAFTLTFDIINGYSDNTEISVFINELTTDDDDYKNDIYEKTLVSQNTYIITDSERFNYSADETGELNLTAYNFNEKRVIIPQTISGTAVTLVSAGAFSRSTKRIIDFSASAASLENNSVNENNIIVCKLDSAVYSAALSQNSCVIALKEMTVADVLNGIILTDKQNTTSLDSLFSVIGISKTADASIIFGDQPLFGTGSLISFSLQGESFNFTLAVKGDFNGDSVNDVIDAFLFERALFCGESFSAAEKVATDINKDGLLSADDYAALVNIALS